MNVHFYIARRIFLRRERERRRGGRPLLGAALGISLSLIPLVTVDHVAAAMIDGIIARYRETSTFHFQVASWLPVTGEDWKEAADRLSNVPSVREAWVERRGFALARAGGNREGLTLRSLPADLYTDDPDFASYIDFDSGVWDLSGGGKILLGREAARRLGTQVGEVIRALTVKILPNGRRIARVSRFTVTGIFSTGYQDLDRTWAFISLSDGLRVLSPESSQTFVTGLLYAPDTQTIDVRNEFKTYLGDGWTVFSWRDLNYYLLGTLENTRFILMLVMGIIIVVAVVNVLSSLIMLSVDRRREIGVLKCMGASRLQIARIFIAAGVLAASVGTVLGLSAGLLAARFINEIIAFIEAFLGLISRHPVDLLNESYYLQSIPVHIRWKEAALIAAVTLGLSLIASVVPAVRAAKLRPLEVLSRH